MPTNFVDYKTTWFDGSVKIYANKNQGFIDLSKIEKNKGLIKKYKLFIPKAIGSGDIRTDRLKPIIAEPNTCCTETYVVIGPFEDLTRTKNAISYIETNFFHFLLGLKKITQDATLKVYQFVPLQDFNETWTDEKLYKKYGLTQEEIDFIESMIRPME